MGFVVDPAMKLSKAEILRLRQKILGLISSVLTAETRLKDVSVAVTSNMGFPSSSDFVRGKVFMKHLFRTMCLIVFRILGGCLVVTGGALCIDVLIPKSKAVPWGWLKEMSLGFVFITIGIAMYKCIREPQDD